MHVAVRREPDVGLVVELVEPHPAGGRAAVLRVQVADPLGDEGGARPPAGVGRVVPGDVLPGGVHAVAAVGVVRIGSLLRAVLGHAEPARLGPGFGRPADQRHGDDAVRAVAPVLADELVRGGPARQRGRVLDRVGDVLEVPVAGVVGGVQQVVIPGGGVAAPADHGELELALQAGRSEVHAIDVAVDRVAPGGQADAQRRPGSRGAVCRRRAAGTRCGADAREHDRGGDQGHGFATHEDPLGGGGRGETVAAACPRRRPIGNGPDHARPSHARASDRD